MLRLTDIHKDYAAGDMKVEALRGVTLSFRKSEFVCVLGPSGCGKTTLLNIIGGLDHYTSGDLCVAGVSTKEYRDADWDAYRNHSIGFVFQSYNLIPHQSVQNNVELALTLSGVDRAERKRRAVAALKRVGLEDQVRKKPGQMSGGQMQRVAIARALVNNPDILLADEPTGALDTDTSEPVMELLKEISREKLVVMVTHNEELARRYATRIINLLDGRVTNDSDPYQPDEALPAPKDERARKPSMSFLTAFSLSMNNLLTKRARTLLTSLAGSIGIIGIALIMALQSGATNYIARVEEDTLSSYPVTIEAQTMNMGGMMNMFSEMRPGHADESREKDRVYPSTALQGMLASMTSQMQSNNLKAFKAFLDARADQVAALTNDVKYGYGVDLYVYKDSADTVQRLNPSTLMDDIGATDIYGGADIMQMYYEQMNMWEEMIGNQELLSSQYEVLAGQWPSSPDEVVIVVSRGNRLNPFALYALGLRPTENLRAQFQAAMAGDTDALSDPTDETGYSYDELLGLTFKAVPPCDLYRNVSGVWASGQNDEAFMLDKIASGVTLRVSGILSAREDAAASAITGSIGYLPELSAMIMQKTQESAVVQAQLAAPETDVFTGLAFGEAGEGMSFDLSMLTDTQRAMLENLGEDQLKTLMERYGAGVKSASSLNENLAALGVADLDTPTSISLYPVSFEAKESISALIDEYNAACVAEGTPENAITYTDFVGILMSSVTTIIDAISYVLIAFVAISLVVSSIMIGVITYISVLERTKEIGVLRAIGASKRDVARVFNAETLLVGLTAGALGIAVTLLLCIPINLIIQSLTAIPGLAALPLTGGAFLVVLSMALTLIAGLIPSRLAARRDPVEALRSE